MKILSLWSLSLIFLFSTCVIAAEKSLKISSEDSYMIAKKKKRSKRRSRSKSRRARSRKKKRSARRSRSASSFSKGLRLAKQGQYQEASKLLFPLSRRAEYKAERNQIKYVLGLIFYELKFDQIAAFQFVDLVRQNDRKYSRQSLEKLSLSADRLGDETLLNYAISKVNLSSFPKDHRDMLYFRIGQYKVNAKDFRGAARNFSRVDQSSRYYYRAKYNEGLVYAEMKKPKRALKAFLQLAQAREGSQVTDKIRVSAILSIARVYYQMKKWDKALAYYRRIPRDTPEWHDAMFEMSWSLLRSARFRSALSTFQSLHSEFYQSFYLPESLLVRSIVYLYICKYDEMKKVLSQFENRYLPMMRKVTKFIALNSSPKNYYRELLGFVEVEDTYIKKGRVSKEFKIPYTVGRHILKESDISQSLDYLKKLLRERQRFDNMPDSWRNSAVGAYAEKIFATRIKNTRTLIGKQFKNHLIGVKNELRDLNEQAELIRFEMLNGKKELLKKRIAGKGLDGLQIDEKSDRDFYVQNGYEYWPFNGEYWLDELGNYHYMGTQSCL